MHVEEPFEEYEFASIDTGDLNLEALISVALYVVSDAYLIFENDEPGDTNEEIIEEMNRGIEVIAAVQDRMLGHGIALDP